MLVAAIFIILIISTLAAGVMRERQVDLPRVWLLLAGMSLLVWLMVLIIPRDGPVLFTISNWFKSGNSRVDLHFSISSTNWPLILALQAVYIAFLFVSSSRQELDRDFSYWIIEAGEIAMAYAVLTAADLWTVIISWTALDVGNLAYQLFFQKKTENEALVVPIVFKLTGSLLLIFATAMIAGKNQSFLLADIPASSSNLIFFAAILHSGILPFKFPEKGKRDIETAMNVLSFLIPFISSMFLISYLPEGDFPFLSALMLGFFAIGLIIYFGLLWMKSREEIKGIYYLSLSFVGFAVYRFLTGSHAGLMPWLVLMLLCGSWLVLFSHRGKSTRLFTAFLLISMMGLPFTLNSYGRSSLFASGFNLSSIFTMVFHALYLIGIFHFFAMEKESFDDLDSSSQMNYLTAIFITGISVVLIAFRSMGSLADELSYWWVGLLVSLAAFGFIFWQRKRSETIPENVMEGQPLIEEQRNQRIQKVLSFDWFVAVVKIVAARIRPLVTGFSQLMEGEGGILWSIVFLALLVTLLKTG